MNILAIDPGTDNDKQCLSCLKILPLAEFHKCKKGRLGRQAKCKSCTNQLYYTPRKEIRLAQTKARRATPEGREKERIWRNEYRRVHRLRRLLQEAKTRAARRGWDFDITESELVIPEYCPVLGIPITLDAERRMDGSPSLERIDRDKGYVSGNVIVISWRANRIKSDASISELTKIVSFYKELLQ